MFEEKIVGIDKQLGEIMKLLTESKKSPPVIADKPSKGNLPKKHLDR